MMTNAVIGFPLAHTLSPVLHQAIYDRLHLSARMDALPGADIHALVRRIRGEKIPLTAVTIPHKETIIPLLDVVDRNASAIGAVNTVINRDGVLHGYNTDVVGIEAALASVPLKEKKVLLLGAGGAARAVAFYLSRLGAEWICVSRGGNKAKLLAHHFGGGVVTPSDVSVAAVDIIINATPVGMFPDGNVSPFDYRLLRSHHIVFDLIYRPLETTLLSAAERIGARTISGLTMFIAQGIEQERLWLGDNRVSRGLFSPVHAFMIDYCQTMTAKSPGD